MTRLTITIPGKPFAWRRARSNGKLRFKDSATESHEAALQAIYLSAMRAAGLQAMEGPLRISVRATFKVPASWSKKRQEAALWRPHTQKPDLSNLIKHVEDGLNRIAWVDDAQIAEITGCTKLWGDRDETVLVVEGME